MNERKRGKLLYNQEATTLLTDTQQFNFSHYYDYKSAKSLSYGDYLYSEPPQSIGDIIEKETDRRIVANAFLAQHIQSSIIETNIASAKVMYHGLREINGTLIRHFNGVTQRLDVVNNNIQKGFTDVTRQLGKMKAEMYEGLARLDNSVWETSKNICDRLDEINDILSNPRLTKARELSFIGLTEYKKGFYKEALGDFQEAAELHKTDYFSRFYIGLTYLFGKNKNYDVVNLDASIEALVLSARYIQPDTVTEQKAKLMAAEIYFFLGLAQQTKAMVSIHEKKEYKNLLEQAKDSYFQSSQYSPDMLEARYNRARCNLLLNNVNEAMKELGEIILQDYSYCIKAGMENDFSLANTALQKLFNIIKAKLFPEVKTYFDRIEKIKNKIQDTQFPELIQLFKMYSSDTLNINMPLFDIREKYLLYKNILLIYKEFLERIVFRISINQINLLKGQGGKELKSLCEQYCVKIDIKDDGFVTILGKNKEKARKAIIDIIATVLEVGNVYYGIVTSIDDIGVFVEISPGKKGNIVYYSKLSRERIYNVKDVVKEKGQEIPVKLNTIDREGRLFFSYIDAIDWQSGVPEKYLI